MRRRLNSTCAHRASATDRSMRSLEPTTVLQTATLMLATKNDAGGATLAAALSCSSIDRRYSELSQVRQQRWSLLRRHEPAIDHETVRRKNRREVWRRVEPGRSPEERVVVVEHGIERRC
jgi:hypothetical protein